jgi:NADPH:quinone reductase-like Zn-dependent oxidoreductase
VHAWMVRDPGPIVDGPLELVELPEPEPGRGEVRVRVEASVSAGLTCIWRRAT